MYQLSANDLLRSTSHVLTTKTVLKTLALQYLTRKQAAEANKLKSFNQQPKQRKEGHFPHLQRRKKKFSLMLLVLESSKYLELKCLYRGGNILQRVPFCECLRSFVDFLEDSKGSCDKIVLVGHNSASFDAHILLRTIQEYSPELLHTIKELNIHFADSLILFRKLIKENHDIKDEGSFVKINQEALYKHLFRTNFQGHDAFEDVKALSKILFKSSLQLSLSKLVNKSGKTDINSAIGDTNYLDRSHGRRSNEEVHSQNARQFWTRFSPP